MVVFGAYYFQERSDLGLEESGTLSSGKWENGWTLDGLSIRVLLETSYEIVMTTSDIVETLFRLPSTIKKNPGDLNLICVIDRVSWLQKWIFLSKAVGLRFCIYIIGGQSYMWNY